MQFFLDKGFDINSIDGDGFTVLHKTILFNKPILVAFLLSKGADPDVDIDMSDHSDKVGVKQMDRLNALKYAIYLTEERNQNRSTIIAMLNKRQQSLKGSEPKAVGGLARLAAKPRRWESHYGV